MKKLITLIAGVVLASSLTFAQAAGPKGGGAQAGGQQQSGQQGHKAHALIGRKIAKQLNLTPEQQNQVKELSEKYQQKHEEQLKSGGKANRKEAAGMRKQFMEDLAKILTPEQKEKLQTLMENAKKNKGGKDQAGSGAKGTTGGSNGTKTGGGGGF